MIVRSVALDRYRNIERCHISFSPGVNVLFGDNGQGKTNLLETIYLFSAGRSFRAGRDRDFVSYEAEDARIRMEFFARGREQSAEMRLFRAGRKQVRMGGVPIKKMAELMGGFSAILFAPEHLDIVKEGPAGRRSFLDFAICQLEPRYYSALAALSRVLTQKSALLRETRKTGAFPATLPVWNEKLALPAAHIMARRAAYIGRIAPAAAARLSALSGGREQLSLAYQTADCFDAGKSENENAERLYEKLMGLRDAECAAGICLAGPQRDDMLISLSGRDARIHASQGQQRSIVLSLKLAEGALAREDCGEQPVYLFDDVLSELDAGRQDYIVSAIEGAQVILTTCGRERFEATGAKEFSVRNGVITEA